MSLRAAVLIALALLLAACQGAPAAPAADVELFVLGVAQDGGLPHLGCEKPCCVEARRTGRVEYPACLGVVDRRFAAPKLLMLEATPRIEEQVALLHRLAAVSGRGRAPVDAVMVTHAHIGHYLGLALFGREVVGAKDLPVWCSPRFADYLRGHGPWKQLVELGQIDVRAFEVGAPFAPWPGVSVQALQVPHRDEFSDTMAYRISGPNRTALFVPDVDAWSKVPGLLDRLLDGVDVAYLDATFYDGSELPGRSLDEIPHPLMTRTMDRLQEQARARPGRLRFLHLNHTNPALHNAQLRAEIAARGFAVAVMGERVVL
ncbi:MAG: MBL fold metallo-hydrolase [Planctomycetota bacterium]|nr:MBL fold metallo-hydrolase [Planctomycetota bacterium]